VSGPEPTRLPPAALAAMLLVTAGRLQVLAREGIIPRAVRGRYELEPVVRAYVAHLAARVARAEVDGSAVVAARARLLEARARAAEAAAARQPLRG
jgi:hypothetical protein